MAGITDKGFIPKTTDEFLEDVSTRANSDDYFGLSFPTGPQSGFHIFSGVLSGEFTSLWDLVQAVVDQQKVSTATGVYLESIAELRGLKRFSAEGSAGNLLFVSSQSTTLPINFSVSDNQNRVVLTQEPLEITRANSYTSSFSVSVVADNTDYIINVESTPYSYNSGVGATEETILEGLRLSLSSGKNFSVEVKDNQVLLTNGLKSNTLTSTNSDNIKLYSIGCLVTGEAVTTGTLDFPANSVTKLVSTNPLLISVTNPDKFVSGREMETDEELRIRLQNLSTSTGSATVPKIKSSLLNLVEGVTAVSITENIEMVTSSSGIPPKSYEIFITGGDEDSIADVVWKTKPAGIKTYGTITKVVIDDSGEEQVVSFSRNSEKYAWQRVSYSIVDPSVYPSDAEDLIKAAIVSKGESMIAGEDYTANKFYGTIYSAVQGIEVTKIEIAVTDSDTATPSYTELTIPVDANTSLLFNNSRIQLTT
ncbi:hypothetical protein NVP1101O_156 [Vibrio phage 1.101.O._10N.261.45.C6]|nr:hypothetical protein NVP1101O_156 [Vibrio phage 1.101.O._10N.261.45.C6]